MRKIINTILIFITTFCLFSCVEKDNKFLLKYNTDGNGTIICEYPSNTYHDGGSIVTLTAEPEDGYSFSGWYENNSKFETINPLAVIVDKRRTITAKFEPDNQTSISAIHDAPAGSYHTLNGTVVDILGRNLLVTDGIGYILVANTGDDNFSQGDYLAISGTTAVFINNIKYFDTNANITFIESKGFTPISPITLESDNILQYVNDNRFGYYIKLSGTLQTDNDKYYMQAGETIVEIDEAAIIDNRFESLHVVVYGYLFGSFDNKIKLFVTEMAEYDNTIDDIAEVLQSTAGASHKVRGTVVAINNIGLMIYDNTGYIQVYLAQEHSYQIGEVLTVAGVLSVWSNNLQFASGSTITKLSTKDYQHPQAQELKGNNFDQYCQSPLLGQYVTIKGRLTVSNSYYNITLTGATFKGSISYPKAGAIDSGLHDKDVILNGYVLGFSGQYLQIMMTSIVSDSSSSSDTIDLSILEVNDLHGYILTDYYNFATLAYHINQIREKNPTLLIANGDMFQGTALSNLSLGYSVLKVMNAIGFDLMGIGNHEFDWGLEAILSYFDGDLSNGEADFPLLNANIFDRSTGQLVTIDGGNIFESLIIERDGVKIGVISYIGDVYSSISYVQAKDYYFDLNIAQSVASIGTVLKDAGADIVVVNVHGGNFYSVEDYDINITLANVKVNNDYLVDAIINGHTHSYQSGYIYRSNGISVPVIQAGANGQNLGEIVLKIDSTTKKVVDSTINFYSVADTSNYDSTIKQILDEEYRQVQTELEEVYVVATETVNYSSQLQNWVASVMLNSTGADIAICNTGGLRSNGNIISNKGITFINIYEINPFDNYIMLVEVKGKNISNFLANSAIFSQLANTVGSIKSETVYRIAVIDYVYYWSNFPSNNSVVNTNLILRDMLILDLKLRDNFAPISNPTAVIDNQYQPVDPFYFIPATSYCLLRRKGEFI